MGKFFGFSNFKKIKKTVNIIHDINSTILQYVQMVHITTFYINNYVLKVHSIIVNRVIYIVGSFEGTDPPVYADEICIGTALKMVEYLSKKTTLIQNL